MHTFRDLLETFVTHDCGVESAITDCAVTEGESVARLVEFVFCVLRKKELLAVVGGLLVVRKGRAHFEGVSTSTMRALNLGSEFGVAVVLVV